MDKTANKCLRSVAFSGFINATVRLSVVVSNNKIALVLKSKSVLKVPGSNLIPEMENLLKC